MVTITTSENDGFSGQGIALDPGERRITARVVNAAVAADDWWTRVRTLSFAFVNRCIGRRHQSWEETG